MSFLFLHVCTARDNFMEQQSGKSPEASYQEQEGRAGLLGGV